jgi:xanthosine utilization system XapX-like protein
MNNVTISGLLAGAVLAALSVQAQPFQNPGFEQANPVSAGVPGEPSFVTAASALPYWTVSTAGLQQTEVSFNDPSTGAPWVVLIGPGANFGLAPLDGSYSVLLQGTYPPGYAAISQTGLIPAGTQSLTFEAEPVLSVAFGVLELEIGTQVVPFTALATGPNYTLYGANISAWADETEQLTFTAMPDSSSMNNWELDDISFSTTAVSPEPNVVALTGIGGLLFGARKWRARRK